MAESNNLMGLCGCIISYTFPPEKNTISDRSAAATLTPAVSAMKEHLEFTTTAATTATAREITKPSPQKMKIEINCNKKQNLKTKKGHLSQEISCVNNNGVYNFFGLQSIKYLQETVDLPLSRKQANLNDTHF